MARVFFFDVVCCFVCPRFAPLHVFACVCACVYGRVPALVVFCFACCWSLGLRLFYFFLFFFFSSPPLAHFSPSLSLVCIYGGVHPRRPPPAAVTIAVANRAFARNVWVWSDGRPACSTAVKPISLPSKCREGGVHMFGSTPPASCRRRLLGVLLYQAASRLLTRPHRSATLYPPPPAPYPLPLPSPSPAPVFHHVALCPAARGASGDAGGGGRGAPRPPSSLLRRRPCCCRSHRHRYSHRRLPGVTPRRRVNALLCGAGSDGDRGCRRRRRGPLQRPRRGAAVGPRPRPRRLFLPRRPAAGAHCQAAPADQARRRARAGGVGGVPRRPRDRHWGHLYRRPAGGTLGGGGGGLRVRSRCPVRGFGGGEGG